MLSNSSSISLTIRMQRILARDWNFVGIDLTDRARLRKNKVFASRSRLACNMADISVSAFLVFFTGGGPARPLELVAVMVVEPPPNVPPIVGIKLLVVVV